MPSLEKLSVFCPMQETFLRVIKVSTSLDQSCCQAHCNRGWYAVLRLGPQGEESDNYDSVRGDHRSSDHAHKMEFWTFFN